MTECKHNRIEQRMVHGHPRAICMACHEDVSDIKIIGYKKAIRDEIPLQPGGKKESIVEQLQREFVNLTSAANKCRKYIEEAQKICQEYNIGNPGDDAVMTVLKEFKRRD